MQMSFVNRFRTVAVAALFGVMVPALTLAAGANIYLQHNLVSSTAGIADVTDPNLLDPWGISQSTASPFWVSDHLAGTATLYNGSGAITALVVTIPAGSASTGFGKPTGQVQNPTTAFLLANGKPASFIFDTEDGTVSAWNSGSVTTAQVLADNSAAGAVYKGLAINPSATAPLLYAANFHTAKIDVFNGSFAPATVPGGFADTNIPTGFAPFNIMNIGGKLYVTYAKQDATQFRDVGGPGNGYVDIFDLNGNLLTRLISSGSLNSPWGIAIAPAGWGAFGGNLLVGNFGDGTINAFDPIAGTALGTLQDINGNRIVIPSLWALQFGNGKSGGDQNTLYFTAGVHGGTPQGLFGSLAPPAAVSVIYNGAGGESSAVAPGEIVVLTGQTTGPSPLVAAAIPATGTLASSLGTTSVTFNNLPAPILYASAAQTSVIVPYGVAGSQTASVVLKTGGQTTAAFSIPVAASMPGVFTSNASGSGPAVVLNFDGSVNSAANSAAKGSVIVLFATGEGVTNPPGQDGLVSTTDVLHEPALPVSVAIGGQTAQVLYAGGAPSTVAGIMEIEALVPAAAASGADAVILTVGTAASQANVTVNVK